MTIRSSSKTVTFRRPSRIHGVDEVVPAGTYRVETDEDLAEGFSAHIRRRILTVIHLPARLGNPGNTRAVSVDPNELDAALDRDRLQSAK